MPPFHAAFTPAFFVPMLSLSYCRVIVIAFFLLLLPRRRPHRLSSPSRLRTRRRPPAESRWRARRRGADAWRARQRLTKTATCPAAIMLLSDESLCRSRFCARLSARVKRKDAQPRTIADCAKDADAITRRRRLLRDICQYDIVAFMLPPTPPVLLFHVACV